MIDALRSKVHLLFCSGKRRYHAGAGAAQCTHQLHERQMPLFIGRRTNGTFENLRIDNALSVYTFTTSANCRIVGNVLRATKVMNRPHQWYSPLEVR